MQAEGQRNIKLGMSHMTDIKLCSRGQVIFVKVLSLPNLASSFPVSHRGTVVDVACC